MGGTVQKGSGSSDFAKGDFRNVGNIRGECKCTSKLVYILKEDELQKIKLEALKGGFEDWVMQVEFLGQVGSSKKFAVVDCKMFMEMWTEARPQGYTSLSSQSIVQVGKSHQLKVDELKYGHGLHVTEILFTEDKETVGTRDPVYLVVPWQAYLDVRKAYMEKQE